MGLPGIEAPQKKCFWGLLCMEGSENKNNEGLPGIEAPEKKYFWGHLCVETLENKKS